MQIHVKHQANTFLRSYIKGLQVKGTDKKQFCTIIQKRLPHQSLRQILRTPRQRVQLVAHVAVRGIKKEMG